MKRAVRWMAMSMLMAAMTAQATDAWRPETRWRGFNLLGMFVKGHSEGTFPEEDFQMIRELGFNFVRLPLDYRFWIVDKDWDRIDEPKLAPVDAAVALGRRYGIHVMLCFHRAPGYTVAKPPESRDLFSDAEALRVCCKHWAFFAKRYKGIPNSSLSFNLFNEPGEVSEEAYGKVGAALVGAIRAEDPSRFIVADGIAWGGRPAQSLFALGIGQATRGYRPMSISHYLASWVGTPTAEPVWPPETAASPLYGVGKAPWNVPLVLEGVPAGTLALKPGTVSGKVVLRAEADGERIGDFVLDAGKGGGWTNVSYKSQWKITQAKCTRVFSCTLPKDARRLSIAVASGDWAELEKVTLTAADGRSAALHLQQDWGRTNAPLRFAGFDAKPAFVPREGALSGIDYLRKEALGPWQPAFDAGSFVMVGEFGAFNHTPHPVVLAWLEDNLRLWKERNLGWAMWNFRGPFGVLGSGRADVAYEDFHGHKLDRKMLDLLQKY